MATDIDMVALRESFKRNNKGNSVGQNNYYPFYDMDFDATAEVRFLADANTDNPLRFLVEKKMHTLMVNGEKKSIACPKTWNINNACPICKVASAYYKADDKENGKIFYRKLQYIGHVLVVKDPLPANKETNETHEGKTRYIAIGNQLYDVIKDTFESGELDVAPYKYEGGTNFIIKKTKKGDYAAYDRSKFARTSTDLDDETIGHVEKSLIDLSTLLPKMPEMDKLEALLEAVLKGEPVREGDDSAPEAPAQQITSAASAAKATTTKPTTSVEAEKPAKEEKVEATSAPVDPEAQAIIERLRARRQQQAAKSA